MSANPRQSAVYAGSFDPPTRGHLWMIEQGAQLFETLTVAIGINPSKHAVYPLETRLGWLSDITSHLSNVTITSFENLFLAHYAKAIRADVILRGMRDVHDYTYEHAMRHINSDLYPRITTVFLIPPRDLIEVSSSTVRGMIGPVGWEAVVERYLPPAIFEDIKSLHAQSMD